MKYDETRPEDELIFLLESTIKNESPDARNKRVEALDELAKIDIKDIDRVADLLIKMMKEQGMSRPESGYIVKILSIIAKSDNAVHEKLLAALEDEDMCTGYCTSKVIQNLDSKMKLRSVEHLMEALKRRNSPDQATNEIFGTLVSMGSEEKEINKKILKHVAPILDIPDGFKVLYAVKIASELGDKSFTPQFCNIVDKSLKGWYNGSNVDILKEISKFFHRIRDRRSLQCLLNILGNSPEIPKETTSALATIVDTYPETLDEIMKASQRKGKEYLLLYVLVEVQKTKIDLNKLFKMIPKDYLNKTAGADFKKIVIGQGESSKPFLLEMVKSNKKRESEFARACLKETGVPFDDIVGVFEESPVLSLYNFFYGKKWSLEKIWEEHDKIEGNIKKAQIEKFDFFVQNLFSSFGFITLYVDPGGRKGVDVVAFSSTCTHIFVIGCTTGILKDDLQKIDETYSKMKSTLGRLARIYTIIPLVFTAKENHVHQNDSDYAREYGIVILTPKEIQNLLELARTGRSGKDAIEYILNLRPRKGIRFKTYSI